MHRISLFQKESLAKGGAQDKKLNALDCLTECVDSVVLNATKEAGVYHIENSTHNKQTIAQIADNLDNHFECTKR